MNYNLVGLPIKHHRFGYGVVKSKDKLGRYTVKFLSGRELGALAESQIDVISPNNMKKENLYENYDKSGIASFIRKRSYYDLVSDCGIVNRLRNYFEEGKDLEFLKDKTIELLKPDKIGHSDVVNSIRNRQTVLDLFSYLYKLEMNLKDDLKSINALLEEITNRIK